jgi:TDG/mug DNA glycosylase family protein
VADESPSAVPDVLAPGLSCVFCGINPGRVSAAAGAHFANPRNDFWRLLHAAGFTPRVLEPQEHFELLQYGYGITNAAFRTTPGSGDLRRGDFDRARLERIAAELRPRTVAFVGKEAYRGLFNERPELGPQLRSLGATGLFVLPSTSPANAAVPWNERLRWFRALRGWIEPEEREAVRALVVDRDDRVLLVRYARPVGDDTWWGTPGGGIDAGETEESALRRELHEEIGLREFDLGPFLFEHDGQFPWSRRLFRQHNRTFLVRIREHDPSPHVDLSAEGVVGVRWWSLDELNASEERFAPADLPERVRTILGA